MCLHLHSYFFSHIVMCLVLSRDVVVCSFFIMFVVVAMDLNDLK